MKFILLHNRDENRTTYVNFDRVDMISPALSGGGTRIIFAGEDWITVNESITEILTRLSTAQ